MKVLIVCDPDEGTSTEICLYLKSEAERMNRRVVFLNLNDLTQNIARFDAVVVAGEMIGGRMRSPFTRFVEQNSAILNEIPSFFLCVHTCLDERNLQVSGQQDKELQQLVTSSAWTPQKSVLLPVGLRLQNNQYSTVANWSDLKIALQAFLIRNDVIMSH